MAEKFSWDDSFWTSPAKHRNYFHQIWTIAKQGKADELTPEERQLVKIMFDHPEYRNQFEIADVLEDNKFDPERETNPFIHVVLHSVMENQLALKKPIEAYQFYLALRKRKLSHHETLHLLMAILAPLMFKVINCREAFDEVRYVRLLRKYMEKKPEKIWNALEQEFTDCYAFDDLDEKPKEEIPELDPVVTRQLDRALKLVKKKSLDAADKIVRNLLENYPNIDLVQFMAGYVLMERQQLIGALAHFDKAIALRPDFVEAWFHKGLVFDELTDTRQAIIAHRKVLKLGDAKDPLVKTSQEILEDYTETLRAQGTTLDGYIQGKEFFERAVAAMEKHRWEEAIAGFSKTISLYPGHVQSYGNIGICNGYLGKKKEALEALEKALEIDPLYEPAIENRKVFQNLRKGEKLTAKLNVIDFYEMQSKAETAGDFPMKDLRKLMRQQEFSSLEEVQDFADQYIEDYNQNPRNDFQGLSPKQMGLMINEPFTTPGLVSFSAAPQSAHAPIMRLFNLLVDAIGEKGMKPTAKGNLSRNFCRDAALQFWGDEEYRRQNEVFSINTEPDFEEMHVTRIVAEQAGLLRKYQGRFILSRSYLKMRASKGLSGVYPKLLEAYTRNFNWGYRDGYPELPMIQDAFLFTLYLITRYGDDWQSSTFYEDLFLRAFPAVVRDVGLSSSRTPEETARRSYSLRCLERFAGFFGLIELAWESGNLSELNFNIRKRPLLDEAVCFHL